MASIGKAGNVETALQGRGNLHGSGSLNGISCSIHAGTTEHVENYHKYLWVCRTPLPMGLHCQNPLFIGEKSPKGPRAPSSVANPSVLPDGPLQATGASTPALPWGRRGKHKCCLIQWTPAVRLMPQRLVPVETHASRLMPQGSCFETCYPYPYAPRTG